MVAVLAEAAIDADEATEAANKSAKGGGGNATAVAAVAVKALEVAVAAVAAAVAADADHGKSKNVIPAVEREEPEAGGAAGEVAEAPSLSAVAGDRAQWDGMAFCWYWYHFFLKIYAVVLFFAFIECYNLFDPFRRGSTLSPGDDPLQPGQYIEGEGGFHKLGWMPGLSWKPKLSVTADGDMVALRPDGSQIILAGDAREGTSRTGVLC
ncbi:unnamed protein product, partial [Laminaria digitata]